MGIDLFKASYLPTLCKVIKVRDFLNKGKIKFHETRVTP